MEVLILGVYLEIFFFRITRSKVRVRIIHGRALYTGKYVMESVYNTHHLEQTMESVYNTHRKFEGRFQGKKVSFFKEGEIILSSWLLACRGLSEDVLSQPRTNDCELSSVVPAMQSTAPSLGVPLFLPTDSRMNKS